MGCGASVSDAAQVERRGAAQPAPDLRRRLRAFAETCSIEVAPIDVGKENGLLELLSAGGPASASQALPPGARVYVNMVKTSLEHFTEVAAAVAALSGSGYAPVPHLPASRFGSTEETHSCFGTLAGAGAAGFLVVGGNDLVERLGSGGCAYKEGATSLLTDEIGLWQEHGVTSVAIAGHPDGHPAFAKSRTKSTALLVQKARPFLEAGVDVTVVSQFCFDPRKLVEWLRSARLELIKLQKEVGQASESRTLGRVFFRLGLPGPTPKKKLERIATICEVPSLFVSSAFDLLDSDNDGFISLQQIEDNASQLGLVRAGSKLERMYAKHADEDGLLRRLEFCELLVEDTDAGPRPSKTQPGDKQISAGTLAVAQGPSTFVAASTAPATDKQMATAQGPVWPEELVLAVAAFCEREAVAEDEVALHLFPFGGLPRTLELIAALLEGKWPELPQTPTAAAAAAVS